MTEVLIPVAGIAGAFIGALILAPLSRHDPDRTTFVFLMWLVMLILLAALVGVLS